MDPYADTNAALATISPAVHYAASRYLPDQAGNYPDQYLVFNQVTNAPAQAADDDETERFVRMQVSIYDRAGLTSALPGAIDQAMTARGFARGPRREQPYSQTTGHFGLVLEYTKLLGEE